MSNEFSRRAFFTLVGVVTVEVATSKRASASARRRSDEVRGSTTDPSSGDPSAIAEILTATLAWSDPAGANALKGQHMQIVLDKSDSFERPLINVTVPAETLMYRFAVAPVSTYYWRVTPVVDGKPQAARAAKGSFKTAPPNRDPRDEDEDYRSDIPVGKPMPGGGTAPISPWFWKKTFDDPKPPTFDQVKDKFPVPILDAAPGVMDIYWFAWKTLMNQSVYPPPKGPHQAVRNLLGYPQWAGVGATMVWDSAFILAFARYGYHAYPFITGFDNMYARQHENGYLCRESDNFNVERIVGFPINPPLFAWTEWSQYELTGDEERLAQVLPPIVKHYEWWVKFQRRPNGLYWTDGFQEADDSPRNGLMYFAASASSYQALAALSLARIAKVLHRSDLVDYFESEHAAIGKMVNEHFWDEKHQIYNDLDKNGKFITEYEPGKFCKHGHMFWPMLAEIAPKERVNGMIRELQNPKSFFRSSGVPSLSADSEGYSPPAGHYWLGSVWPPIQSMVQSGLAVCGQWELAQQFAAHYSSALTTAYQKETFYNSPAGDEQVKGHTITEYLYPDEPTGGGVGDFVGWGGIGPIQDLIEYTLGFKVDAPSSTITWRITRMDKHGIEKLGMGKSTYNLLCAARSSATDPCHITVKAGTPFTLKVIMNGKEQIKQIQQGEQTITV